MKILVSRISPGTVGGAELSAFDQAVALKELGHNPVLVTNLSVLRKRARKEGIETAWLPWINRGPSFLRIFIYFLLLPATYILAVVLAIKHRPEIINPHSREDQNAFTLTKWLHGRPVIWKDAGDFRMQLAVGSGNPARKLNQTIQKRAIQKADHIYLLNEGDRQNLANIVGDWVLAKTTAIPASILYRYYNRSPKTTDSNEKLVVGTLARTEENKGLQYLIEAIKQLGCRDGVEYWIVGEGAFLNDLKRLANNHPCIKFKPHTDDVSTYLNAYDVLVHPAEAEGWGRIIKEGMYFGLPIVGSNVGGIALQIEDGKTGLLFEVGDVEGLKKRLDKLITDKELRKRLGNNARKKAEADGDFTEIVKAQIIPLYQSFLD